MAWIEHGLQISLKRYTLSMEDKMAAGSLWMRYELWARRPLMDNRSRSFMDRKVRLSSNTVTDWVSQFSSENHLQRAFRTNSPFV